MPDAEIPQAVQIIRQHVAIATRQPIVLYHSLHGGDHFIEFPLVIAAGGELALEFIQFLQGRRQPVLVSAERERRRSNMVQVFPDVLKKLLAPILAAKPIVPISLAGLPRAA